MMTCAWCPNTMIAWAAIEPGWATTQPSCGEHGYDHKVSSGDLAAALATAWDQGNLAKGEWNAADPSLNPYIVTA